MPKTIELGQGEILSIKLPNGEMLNIGTVQSGPSREEVLLQYVGDAKTRITSHIDGIHTGTLSDFNLLCLDCWKG